MAREIVNRQVNVYIQSGNAQKVYDQLIAKQKKLKDELALTTDPKRVQVLNNELAKLTEPLDRAARKVKGELEPSLRDMQATVAKLRNELSRMSESDPKFKEKVALYRQATQELEAQRGKVGMLSKAWKSFWQEAKTVAVGVIIGNTIQSALQTVMGYVTGIVTGSAKISDELADIQRITGLTAGEVREINAALKQIDTRTSTSALREVTLVAGRLGIEGKDNIIQFVEAVDRLNIAMGGELGNIDTFTTDLGKILNVFDGEINGDNITAVGNAIVDLANKGVASGPFIVDFTQRIAGIAKTANLSLDAVIGLAAGLEETGNRVESSATAIQKLLINVASDIPAAAKVAGMEMEEFNKLFSETPQEALIRYAEGLVKNKQSFTEVTAALKEQGEEGARVISVITTLGQRGELFRQKMVDSGKAIKDTTAITDAFNLKNQTAGAELDKLRKAVAGVFQSSTFQQAGESAVKMMTGFVNVLKASFQFIKEHGGLVATLATLYALLAVRIKGATIAQAAKNLVEKAGIIITQTITAAQALYVAVTMRSVQGLTLARRAQMAWNAAASMGAGPLGILIVGIGALIVGLQRLFSGSQKVTAQMKAQAEITKMVNEETTSIIQKTKDLAAVASDANVSLDNRKKALDALIAQSPDYLKGLTLENIATSEGKKIIDGYTASLVKQAEVKAKITLRDQKQLELEEFLQNLRAKNKELAGLTNDQLIAGIRNYAENGNSIQRKLAKQITEQLDLIDNLNKDITDAAKKNVEAITSTTTTEIDESATANARTIASVKKQIKDLDDAYESIDVTDKKKLADNRAARDKLQKELDALDGKVNKAAAGAAKKAESEMQKLLKDLQAIRNSLGMTGLSAIEQEIKQLDIRYAELRERAKGNKKLLLVIEELYAQERIRVIQKFGKLELEAWSKSQEGISKKAEEQMKKNLEALKKAEEVFYKNASDQVEKIDKGRIAQRELAVLKLIRSTGKERLKAELALLDEQERQELQKKELTEREKLLIEEKYRRLREDAETDHITGLIALYAHFLQGLLDVYSIFAQARTDKENAELERDRYLNDKKKQNLENRLKSGKISQLQYDRELQKIEKDQEKREKEARKKQFERDKRAKMVQAVINFAGAVNTTLEKFGPPLPPNFLGIAAMALTTLTGIAQIATIASSKAPEYGRGGKLGGRSHDQGGNAIMDGHGRKIGEIEKDEGIINKFSMGDKKRYTVSGTPSQIGSAINSLHGGRSWDSGATLRPAWSYVKPQPMNMAAINKYYAAGGRFNTEDETASAPENSQSIALMQALYETIERLNARLAEPLEAFVVLSNLVRKQQRLDTIRKEAALK